MSSIRLPDGARHQGVDDEGHSVFTVSMPSDEDGYLGRQCPECHQIFRITSEDYAALPDDITLWCVYCGRTDDHSDFMTDQQRRRATRVAMDYANQVAGQTLDRAFGDLARRSRANKHVQFTYRPAPFFPEPLPGIDEERLIRALACPKCGLHYAVFGEHRFCPQCGPLPPEAIAEDSLNAEERKLDLLSAMPAVAAQEARHHGVLDRIYADTIKSVVTIVEAHAKSAFFAQVPDAPDLVRAKGNIFQRLDASADLFDTCLNVDIRHAPGVDWSQATRLWAVRHVLTHNDGLVDEKFMKAVPGAGPKPGQRLVVKEPDARLAVAQARAICLAIGRRPVAKQPGG